MRRVHVAQEETRSRYLDAAAAATENAPQAQYLARSRCDATCMISPITCIIIYECSTAGGL